MGQVRQDIVSRATPEQLERMRKAEAARGVYRAWNAVCGGTREGRHVTGLRYLPDTNELLVYLDDASWTQEMTMLREIIRARMDRLGVKLDGFVFRTSKKEYIPRAAAMAEASVETDAEGRRYAYVGPSHLKVVVPSKAAHRDVPHQELTAQEERTLDEAVSGIADQGLAKALKNAMKASFEWKKGEQA